MSRARCLSQSTGTQLYGKGSERDKAPAASEDPSARFRLTSRCNLTLLTPSYILCRQTLLVHGRHAPGSAPEIVTQPLEIQALFRRS
jgi:hypothetical protein